MTQSAFHNLTLCNFRYEGPLLEEGIFEKALEDGPSSVEFTKLVESFTKEMCALTGLDDYVNTVSGIDSIFMYIKWFLINEHLYYMYIMITYIKIQFSRAGGLVQMIEFLAVTVYYVDPIY